MTACVVSSPRRAPSSGGISAGTRPIGSGLMPSSYPICLQRLEEADEIDDPFARHVALVVADFFGRRGLRVGDVHVDDR